MFLHFLLNMIYLEQIINYRECIMKKLLTLFMSLLLVFSLTGCSETYLKVDALFWQNSTQGYDNTFYEELVYDVTCEKTTISNSTAVSNEEVELVINNGSYTVISKSAPEKGTSVVCVQTTLRIDGKYVDKTDNDREMPFVDEITSTCYFVSNNFKPISSTKNVKANSLGIESEKYAIFYYEYNYEVNYNGNNANVTFNEIKDDSNIINADAVKEYKDATKNAYLDNEMLLFAPRGYNLLSNTNFSVSFSSLDVISQTTRGMYFTTMANNQSNPTLVTVNALGQEIETVKVIFTLTGQFTGTPIECYYASKAGNRNRLVVCYTEMYGNLGYLKYTLKEIK